MKNRKKRSRQVMAAVLATAMAVPTVLQPMTVNAAAPNDNYENKTKNVLWSTSFEEGESALENFKVSTAETGDRATENVASGLPTGGVKGSVMKKVDLTSVTGTENYNTTETKEKLFDENPETKFYTRIDKNSPHAPSADDPVWVNFSLQDNAEEVITMYSLTSANDSSNRDPKAWTLKASKDGQNWVVLDQQANQSFASRFAENVYKIDNQEAYAHYRLEITQNNGSTVDTQLADLTLGTGVDTAVGDPFMVTQLSKGPASAWNQKNNVGWTGKAALEATATQIGDDAYASNVLFDNLNTEITDDTYLSYVIFPSLASSAYDYEYTAMHMAIDLKFKDGTYLSDLAVLDQNENPLNAAAQGASRVLNTNQWNRIYANIGEVAKGKIVDQVLVVFDKDGRTSDQKVNFRAYFDDIELYTKQDTTREHLSDYVYILRGTNDTPGFSRGLTAPAVTAPHGFNFWVPCTNRSDNKTYDYQDTQLQYVTVSHEPSYWVGDRGTWQFMVNTSLNGDSGSYNANQSAADFSHDNEVAKAHYYSVEFDKNAGNAKGAKMEMTSTDHCGVVRATFDEDVVNKNYIFDCVRAGGGFTFDETGRTFTAYSDHTGNGSKRMYVYGEFSETPTKANVNGKQAVAQFAGNDVELKIATSYISYDQAKKSMELEVGDAGFDEVMQASQAIWDNKLGIITDVEGATEEELISLYSNIYRLFMYPNNMSENTGTNEAPNWKYKSPYRDNNAEPVSGKIYINNGFWDTYRTAWSAYALFTPEYDTELLNGLVQHYKDQTWVPRWIAPGGTNSMVGTSSDVVFADAMVKGIEFDREDAYASALRNAATVSSNLTNGGRKNLNTSIFQGYTAGTDQNFSWSMEGYINDFGISQMAKVLVEETDDPVKKADYQSEYQYYVNRAQNYALLFDNAGDDISQKWLRGKESNGSWTTENTTDGVYDPVRWAGDYTETNAFNMAVSVPQDAQGLANLYGGRDQMAAKIDTIMTDETPFSGYGATDGNGGIHEQKEAREVKMGQYGHNNQPSHHILYMYNYAGQPWKAQKYVRDVLDRCYTGSTFGQGYLGDEDNGEMSGWYIFSALGFYPVTVGSNEYAIGSPLFDSATINMDNGKKITVTANNNNKQNVYVQSVTLNGEAHTKNYFTHEELANGAEIVFEMGSEPNTAWGSGEDDVPTSITKGDAIPDPKKDATNGIPASDMAADDLMPEDIASGTLTGNIANVKSLIDNNSNTAAALQEDKTVLGYAADTPKNVEIVTLTADATKDSAPTSMKIYGANEGDDWTELASYDNIEFRWTRYTRPFAVNSTEKYSCYKVELTGGTSLAEIEFLTESNVDEDLKALLLRARKVLRDHIDLSDHLRDLLEEEIRAAQVVANDETATAQEKQNAYQSLQAIVSRIENIRSAHERIEAEEFSDKHSDIVNDGANIGGVKKNTWTMYQDVRFDGPVDSFEIYYSAQSSDAGGFVEVYLDELNNEEKKLLTIQTPKTGSWSQYVLVDTTEIDNSKITLGNHNVYLAFKNSTSDPYVANVDWFRLNLSDAVQKIASIGEVTLASKDAIEAARAAYDALTDEKKALVTNLNVLKTAERKLNKLLAQVQAKIDDVTGKIAAIDENVTLASEPAVTEARNAYQALSDEEKMYVPSEAVSKLKDAEDAITQLKAGAKSVADQIAKIGYVTFASESAILDARGAYDALSAEQKALVTNVQTLIDAENALAALKAGVNTVKDQIGGLGNITLASETAVEAARTAYDALTAEQKARIDNVDVLKNAEKTLVRLKSEVESAMGLITAIGEVTLDSEDAIKLARAAYNKLTAEQKEKVTNYAALTNAESTLAGLKNQQGSQAKVQSVIDKIAAIGDVTLQSEKAIGEARTAYNALSKAEQALVTNANVLTTAESSLSTLKVDHRAADTVIDLINQIGNVTLDSESAIGEARTEYNKLNQEQKALVTNFSVLTNAEGIVNRLKAQVKADAVMAQIAAIGRITMDSEAAIQEASSAYEALTEEEKALVLNAATLQNATEELAELKENHLAATAVSGLIDQIGDVTLASKEAVDKAREAFDQLTGVQKGLVENLAKLTQAEVKLAQMNNELAAISKVMELIGKLDTITVNSGKEIEAARAAYNILSDEQKTLVTNLEILENAEKKIVELTDQAAAGEVKQLIESLATVTENDKAKVEAVRKAYDALTDAQKALVGNAVQALEAAEKKVENSQGAKPDEQQKPVQITRPSIKSVKNSIGKKATGRVKITFLRPADGQEIYVYRKVDKIESFVGKTTGTYVYDNNPVSGKKASYYLQAVSKDVTKYLDSEKSVEVTISIPADPKSVKAEAIGKKQVKVTWSKVKGAKKYCIYRSTKKSSGYTRIAVLKASRSSYVDKTAKVGKKYYYKVVVKKASQFSAGKASKIVTVKK